MKDKCFDDSEINFSDQYFMDEKEYHDYLDFLANCYLAEEADIKDYLESWKADFLKDQDDHEMSDNELYGYK